MSHLVSCSLFRHQKCSPPSANQTQKTKLGEITALKKITFPRLFFEQKIHREISPYTTTQNHEKTIHPKTTIEDIY